MKIKTLQFESIEAKLFYLFSILNLIPIFLVKYFGSIDAPQHLYISNVIDELWRSNELFEQFFKFNNIIVGNWISHFLLAIFNFVLPAWIAEKILLTIYILGMAFSFRYLITGINKKSTFISFLIFPFTYNTLFHYSHYNYNFGIIVMLIIFGYWIRVENNLSVYKILTVLSLLTLLFLSHMFVYTFFVGSFGLYILFSFFISLNNQKEKKVIFVRFLKKILYVFIALIPSLILWVIYWKSVSGYTKSLRFSVPQLIDDLYNIKSLIGYHYSIEAGENNYLFILLCILFLYIIIYRVRSYRKSKTGIIKPTFNLSNFFKPTDFWLLLTFVFLLFYFIIPDRLSAGNISARLSILLFTFFIIWLSIQEFSRLMSIITVVIIIIYSINIRVIQNKNLTGLDRDIKEICELNTFIEPNSLYYQINYNPNWIKIHYLNYIGVDEPLVSVELPNCAGPFPIIDTRDQLPVVLLGNVDLDKFCYHCSNRDKSHTSKIVEYIIIGGATIFSGSDDYYDVKKILKDHYEIVYTSSGKNIELYKLKI